MNYQNSKYFTTVSKKKIKYLYIKGANKITVVFFHGFMSNMVGLKPAAIQKFCRSIRIYDTSSNAFRSNESSPGMEKRLFNCDDRIDNT